MWDAPVHLSRCGSRYRTLGGKKIICRQETKVARKIDVFLLVLGFWLGLAGREVRFTTHHCLGMVSD